MSPEAQRIAIAEACGWERYPEKDLSFGCEYWARFTDGHFKEDVCDYSGVLPDYLNDLNAMHEAEKTLVDPVSYVSWLYNGAAKHRERSTEWTALANATAAQRAEAFLKTIGKWDSSASCADCDALASDGYNDGPCERHSEGGAS